MDDFIKKFPNLKGKTIYVDEFKVGEIPEEKVIVGGLSNRHKIKKITIKKAQEPNSFRGRTYEYLEGNVYSEKSIMENCLDKQRVIEVINKHILTEHPLQSKILWKIKKELRIE